MRKGRGRREVWCGGHKSWPSWRGGRRGRGRGDAGAYHVRVMASRRHVEDNFSSDEDGRDHGDVWQVASSGQLRVVAHEHVAVVDVRAPISAVRAGVDVYRCVEVCIDTYRSG